jgi:hypothetical protein
MTTLELTLNIPDELASKAQAAGLLNSEAIEKLLREQLRKQAGQELRAMRRQSRRLGHAADERGGNSSRDRCLSRRAPRSRGTAS